MLSQFPVHLQLVVSPYSLFREQVQTWGEGFTNAAVNWSLLLYMVDHPSQFISYLPRVVKITSGRDERVMDYTFDSVLRM